MIARVELPNGVHPGKVPSRDVLDGLTEDDLFAVIEYQQTQNFTYVGTQFWIDELSRRRTKEVLDNIALASAKEAEQAAEIVQLTAAAAAENARTANLNQEMRDMTRTMMLMTGVSVLFVAAALVVAVVALLQGR